MKVPVPGGGEYCGGLARLPLSLVVNAIRAGLNVYADYSMGFTFALNKYCAPLK